MVQLKNSLEAIVPIKQLSQNSDNPSLALLGEQLELCEDLRSKIKQTLDEQAPVHIIKGNAIAHGFNEELDDLRAVAQGGKQYLDQMLARETQRTGISSLKIASNNVFGYYIEVRNTHKDKVPPEWTRKQTLVSAERYITEELKQYETKILGAEEKIAVLEHTIFNELLEWMLTFIAPVQQNAKAYCRARLPL